MYTSFVIIDASNTPIFSIRCISFQSPPCINLLPLVTIESTVRYLGIEVDDALEISEQTEI